MSRRHLLLVVVLTVGMLLQGMPMAAAQQDEFDVLVFHRTTGFRHPSTPVAIATIEDLGAANGFTVAETEDASVFTDEGLADYEAIVFLTDGENTLDADQREAFQRFIRQGGGYAGIHQASNMDTTDWAWYEDLLGGAFFQNHPSGNLQFQTATVEIEDQSHPSTDHLPQQWEREDEWYNFTANPREGGVHVLMTLDESTYEEQDGSAAADDHPIAWCSNFDGGRTWYTALGHSSEYWEQEPLFQEHVLGGIQWAAGAVEGDCGEPREARPTDASFEKVALDDNTANPMELAVAPNGDVYYVELGGNVKRYEAGTGAVSVVGNIPVHRGNENGLLGIALDPNFAENQWLYLFYSAPEPEVQHVSRFTVIDDGATLDMGSEQVLLEIPHQRTICCHSSGSLQFGPDGNLFISTGDDTAHYASQGYAPIDDRLNPENLSPPENYSDDALRAYDARRTSGNTNDLRGKILRITPQPDGTYTVPEGNLFPEAEDPGDLTRPEIYTMGHRNPFRIAVDQETGWVYNGEVGPDANNDNPNRGPRGYDEWNQIREAGNYGWPYCIADNQAYVEYDFATGESGEPFDCENGPANDSEWNTGLDQVPPAQDAFVWYPYGTSPEFPELPTGNGRTAYAGAVYHYDESIESDGQFPEYYDDAVFVMEWSRNWMGLFRLDENGDYAGFEQFMPETPFASPHDMEFGPDGSMYLIEWGVNFNYAGGGVNSDSGLYRISYAEGTRSPVAQASADVTSGPSPLTVEFSSEGTFDADGDPLEYRWVFGDGNESTDANPTHTFTEAGTYQVQLIATDPTDRRGTSNVTIQVGNTEPEVTIEFPEHGTFFDFGDDVRYVVNVTDPEDAEIDCSRVIVTPGLYHDEGGNAHVHPGTEQTGCEGVITTPVNDHAESAKIALIVTATYTDTGGEEGSAQLTGGESHFLNQRTIQAEHFDAMEGIQVNTGLENAAGGEHVGYVHGGDWIMFEPVNFHQIHSVTYRYTSAHGTGPGVELRLGSPDGELVSQTHLPGTGGWANYNEVTAEIDAVEGTHALYVVFTGGAHLVDLDEMRFHGQGVSLNAAPTVSIEATPTEGAAPLTVEFTSEASDPEGEDVTYAWDFDGDGEVDSTEAAGSFTYTEGGTHTAALTVADEGGRSARATVDIRVSAPAPDCLSPGSDQFDGETLDTDTWTVIEPAEGLEVSGGALRITPPPNRDMFANDGTQPNVVVQPVPEGPWTATVKMNWQPTQNYQNAGLVVYGDETEFLKTAMVYAGGRAFEAFKETNNSPTNLGNFSVPSGVGNDFYMRYAYDGTEVQAYYSADGVAFEPIGNPATLAGIDDPKIGMFATASAGNSSTTQPTAAFDWFALNSTEAADVDPSDEFEGDSLDVCRWSEIVRHDPDGYTVADGVLSLPAAEGDFFGNAANENTNMILQPAPDADYWRVTTKVDFVPTENYQQAGILVYGDDANYVKANLVSAGGNRTFEFLHEIDNAPGGFNGSVTVPQDFPSEFFLRVTAEDGTLVAEFSPDGEDWTQFGQPTDLSIPGTSPTIGIYANDGAQNTSTTPVAEFDFFRVTTEEEPVDEIAPVATAELVGDRDDDGNFIGEATVVLDAADDEGGSGVLDIEYRLNDGDWVVYLFPVSVPELGEHVVTYRATDRAGNVSEEQAVTFTVVEPLDETAPTTDVTLTGDTNAAGEYTDAVTVALTAEDDTEVASIEYRINDGDWTVFDGPFELSEPGTYELAVRATDTAGNVSAEHIVEFSIAEPPDETAPAVDVTLTGDVDDEGDYTGPVTVEITAEDDDSGVETVEYRLDGGDWTAYDGPFEVTELGEHTVVFRATDAAGNVSEEGSITFMIVHPGACPEPDDRDTVVIGGVDTRVANREVADGCTINDLIDDEGSWANHGQFVSHVNEVADQLRADGVISGRDRGRLTSAAARSDVGSPDNGNGNGNNGNNGRGNPRNAR